MQQPGQNNREARPDIQEHTQLTAGGTPTAGEFKVGDIIGGSYRVQKWIGAGGMGNVYRVQHTMMQSEYALKTLSADKVTEVAWRRFQNEAQAIARMNHPNVVGIYNLDLHEGRLPFYVMDLLQGDTMLDYLRINGPMEVDKALPLFIEICAGLGYAHKKGIVHRDVKPPNIVLLDNPEANCKLKIVDFGIAKLSGVKDPQNQYLTNAGEVCGSPYYMSPEQTEGLRIDARSDIYSLGCTLFEMLIGAPPLRGKSAVETMIMHQTAVPPTLKVASGGKDFPEMLERVVATMLAKKPMDRYQTMELVMQDLTLIKGGQEAAINPFATQSHKPLGRGDLGDRSAGPRSDAEADSEDQPTSKPYLKILAAGLALSIAVGGVSAVMWWQSGRQPNPVKSVTTTNIVQKAQEGLSVDDANLGITVLSKKGPSEDPIDPNYILEKPKTSQHDTQFFSSMQEEDGHLVRIFNFPSDFAMGDVKPEKGNGREAKGILQFPPYGPICFEPSVVLADYPQYIRRFRPNEVSTVTIRQGQKYDTFEKLLQQTSQLHGLTKLQLEDCTQITSKCIDSINNIGTLKFLGWSGRTLDCGAFAKVKNLQNLIGIACKSSNNADPIVKLLKNNNRIEIIDLSHSTLSHQAFKDLASMKNLKDLSLADMKLDDQDFQLLSNCQSLRLLSTERTKLTAQRLMCLQRLKLRKLTVLEPDIAPLTNADVESKLPGVRVECGGQLGEQARMVLQ